MCLNINILLYKYFIMNVKDSILQIGYRNINIIIVNAILFDYDRIYSKQNIEANLDYKM